MKTNIPFKFRNGITRSALGGLGLARSGLLWPDSPPAFGGGFAPQMAQQGPRYQIAGCDANSAWVIDTAAGDVYLIYGNGKWKEVGALWTRRNGSNPRGRIKTHGGGFAGKDGEVESGNFKSILGGGI